MSPTVQATSFRTILSCVLALASSGALAQTAIDDVHITPLQKSEDVATAAYPAVGNYMGGSVIRTNVNLVLVPVTITDNLHRPVAGLDQDNFQVFEGKAAQEIKNF